MLRSLGESPKAEARPASPALWSSLLQLTPVQKNHKLYQWRHSWRVKVEWRRDSQYVFVAVQSLFESHFSRLHPPQLCELVCSLLMCNIGCVPDCMFVNLSLWVHKCVHTASTQTDALKTFKNVQFWTLHTLNGCKIVNTTKVAGHMFTFLVLV